MNSNSIMKGMYSGMDDFDSDLQLDEEAVDMPSFRQKRMTDGQNLFQSAVEHEDQLLNANKSNNPNNNHDQALSEKRGAEQDPKRGDSIDIDTDLKNNGGDNYLAMTFQQLSESHHPLNDDTHRALNEDIYSLMVVSEFYSFAFWFAGFIFIIQAGFILLLLSDIMDWNNVGYTTNGKSNRMYLPVDVPPRVSIAQIAGMTLMLVLEAVDGDMQIGFTHIVQGYDRRIEKKYKHVTRWKWYFISLIQMLVGGFMAVDLFVLMMQSTTVFAVILGCVALRFIKAIDIVAFKVGTMGMLGGKIQREARKVGNIVMETWDKRYVIRLRRIFLFAQAAALYSFFFVFAVEQWNGDYMCHSLYIQFGDTHGDSWPYYSGIFEVNGTKPGNRIGGRLSYVGPTESVRLAFCAAINAWTFSTITAGDDDVCQYFIRSSYTVSYDVMDVVDRTWYAATPHLGDVPMDWLYAACSDCNNDNCAPGTGTCVDNRCNCTGERFGMFCEFDETGTCSKMSLDLRSVADLSYHASTEFFVKHDINRLKVDGANTMYDHPIYVSVDDDNNVDAFTFFAGYRWLIYGLDPGESSETSLSTFIDYMIENNPEEEPFKTLQNISQGHLPKFSPLFFSAPAEFGSSNHNADPTSDRWVRADNNNQSLLVGARPIDNRFAPAQFLCSECDNITNPCLNGGSCASTRECNCTGPNGFTVYGGSLCEYSYTCLELPCLNGGNCDPILGLCVNCDEGYYGHLCQFTRGKVETLEVSIAGIIDGSARCDNSTCLNGGYCGSDREACICLEMWTGQTCEVPITNLTDGK